jgi:hypothetical protein
MRKLVCRNEKHLGNLVDSKALVSYGKTALEKSATWKLSGCRELL